MLHVQPVADLREARTHASPCLGGPHSRGSFASVGSSASSPLRSRSRVWPESGPQRPGGEENWSFRRDLSPGCRVHQGSQTNLKALSRLRRETWRRKHQLLPNPISNDNPAGLDTRHARPFDRALDSPSMACATSARRNVSPMSSNRPSACPLKPKSSSLGAKMAAVLREYKLHAALTVCLE